MSSTTTPPTTRRHLQAAEQAVGYWLLSQIPNFDQELLDQTCTQLVASLHLLRIHPKPTCAIGLDIGISKLKGPFHPVNFGYQQMPFQAETVDQLEKRL